MGNGKRNLAWILNGHMIAAAVLGWLIFDTTVDIIRVIHHEGPGYITHGDEERGQQETRLVSEQVYKRYKILEEFLFLCFCVWLWVHTASDARDKRKPTPEGS